MSTFVYRDGDDLCASCEMGKSKHVSGGLCPRIITGKSSNGSPQGFVVSSDRRNEEHCARCRKPKSQHPGNACGTGDGHYFVSTDITLTAVRIEDECDAIKAMLVEKNMAYGNSALDPVRVFSRASADEQIKVRLDDKLSRIQRGQALSEDVVLDLIGYLVLLRVAAKMPATG